MPEALIFLLLVLAVIAVLGHLMWVTMAWILRQLVGVTCRRCGRRNWYEPCPYCTAAAAPEKSNTPTAPIDEFLAAKQLIERALQSGFLAGPDADAARALLHRLAVFATAGSHSAPPASLAESAPAMDGLHETGPVQPIDSASGSETQIVEAQVIEPPVGPPAVASRPVQATVHALEKEYPETPPAPNLGQRVSRSLVRAFMERANIRWIELLSAALIVVSAVGLVISLWSTLSATSRFFPSLVFMIATVAVHAAGQYTLRKWRLRTTSRGILHVGLMLIPLSVLLGILLARNEGSVGWTWQTTVAVAVGAIVYGGLIVTSTRTLFAARWKPISATLVVHVASLVGIEYLAAQQALSQPIALYLAVPLLMATTGFTLFLASQFRRPQPRGRALRLAAALIQALFASGVVIGFLLVRGGGELQTPTWWLVGGIASATWAAGGWTVSMRQLPGRQPSRGTAPSSGHGGVALCFWTVFAVAGVLMFASTWFVGPATQPLSGLFAIAGLIWIAHGIVGRDAAARRVGATGAAIGVALWVEMAMAGAGPAAWHAWLSWSRAASMLAVAGGTAVAAIMLHQSRAWIARRASTQAGGRSGTSESSLGARTNGNWFNLALDTLRAAAGGSFVVAVILALAASLSPVAVPAWGGDWASLVVLAAGLGVLGVAVFVLPTRRLKFVPAAAVLGQLIVLYAVIHLCTTGTLLEPLLYTWRPLFAWAAGASAVCLLGAVGVLGGRWRFRPRGDEAEQWLADPAMERATQWTSASTLTVGLAAGMGLAAAGVDMQFAVAAGWMLVATAWLWYMATRWRAWQEVACWTTVLYGVAWSQFAMQRWVDPAALMVPEHVAALVAAGLAALWLCALGLKPMAVLGDRWLGAAALSDGPRPASPPAAPAWLVVLATLALAFAWTPAGLQRVAAALCREFQLSQTMGLSPPGTVVAGVAAAMLWFSPIVLYRQLPSGVRRFVLECVALLFGWIATLAVAGQDAAIALLWTLAAWDLVVSKTLPLLAERIGRESHGRWAATFLNPGIQQMIATARTPFVVWVAIATISVAAVWAAAVQVLPAELSRALQAGEWTSAWTMRMLLFGPALVVGLANWWHSTWRTAHVHSHGANLSATATCATVGVLTSLDGWTATNLWGLESGILFTLYFGLAGGVLGWIHTLRMGPTDGGSNAIRPHERFLVWLTGGATAVLGSVGVGMALGLAFSTSSTEVLTLMARLGAPDGSVLLAFAGSLLLWTHRANRRAGLAQLTTLLPWCVPLFVSHWIYWVEETALVSSIDTFAPSRWIAMGWFLCALTEAPWNRRPGHVRSATMLRYWSGVLLVAALLSLVLAVTDPQHLAVLYVLVLGALVTVTASLNGHELARKTAAIVLGTAGAGLAWYVVWPPASMMHAVLRAVSIGWGPLLVVVAAELQQGLLHRLGIRPFTTDADKPGDVSLIVCGGVALVLLPYTLAAGFLVHANAFYWEVLSAFGLALGAGGLLMMRVLRGCHACRLEPMYLSVLSIAVCGELLAIERLGLSALHHMVLWMVALFMAMVAIAGVVRELYLRYQAWSARLTRLPATVPFDELAKMAQRVINVHMVAGLIGIVPVVTLVLLADDRSLRLAATVIPLLAAVSLLVLPGAHLRRPVQLLGLALLSCTVVMTAWADLPEAAWGAASPVRWAYHHRLFVACSAWAVALHALGAKGMLGRDWIAPIAVVGWVMLAVGTVAGGWLTVLEFIDWRDLAAAAHPAAKGLTLVAWALVFARLLVLAVTPKDLGFDLPRAERHAAVYMAEGVVVVFSAAVYLHFPQWFTGWMVHWWPIVVVMVAYSSLALGQVLQRRRLDVLSDPVARSGLLLPLIPLAGVWWWGVAEDTVWRDFDRFAFLVALAAAFYATYAYTRRTAWAHLVSMALAVLAFWLWLYSQPDLRFARHPQLWIVPPTLIVLAFAEWHRRRLPTSLRLVVRYMSLLLIYSSSTAEVFLRAFAGQFWPPLVLLVLSLTGVAAGIVLRIRPFLYCGALFTAVALVGMVWHAQQAIGQIWPWWAFGIATGVAAIFLLGYIEKNKPRMRAYLEQIREWE